MKLNQALFAAVLLVPLPLLAAPADLSLDEVLSRYYEARGGLDSIKSVESMRSTGTMTMGPMEFPFTSEAKRPGKLRVDFTLQGMTGSQAVDGDSGWQVMPFMGKTEAEPMSGDELRNFKNQADMDGPLIDWQDKGHHVELAGTEEVEGADAYRVEIRLESGDEVTAFIDAEYFLDLKWEVSTTMRGQPIKMSMSFGDYKEVGGLTLPHAISQTIEGMPGAQSFTVERVEMNVPVADERFEMPAPAATGAAASD